MAPAGRVWAQVSHNSASAEDPARIGSDEKPKAANGIASVGEEKAWSSTALLAANDIATPEIGFSCGTVHQRDELLLMRRRMTSSSECAYLGFSLHSVCVRFSDETHVLNARKTKSNQSNHGLAEGSDESTSELQRILDPAAPAFVPRCVSRSAQVGPLFPRRPVQEAASVRSAGKSLVQGFHGQVPQFLTTNAKELFPHQGCPKATPGLSARDIEFILNPSRLPRMP